MKINKRLPRTDKRLLETDKRLLETDRRRLKANKRLTKTNKWFPVFLFLLLLCAPEGGNARLVENVREAVRPDEPEAASEGRVTASAGWKPVSEGRVTASAGWKPVSEGRVTASAGWKPASEGRVIASDDLKKGSDDLKKGCDNLKKSCDGFKKAGDDLKKGCNDLKSAPDASENVGASAAPLWLTLEKAISLAADSSLQAFRNQNLFLAGYWEFRTYRAERLPSLTLNVTPAEYYRDITKRYDSENDRDIYRKQQSFYAGGNLRVKQNFDLLGGSFFLDSDLGYMRYFGDDTYNQFTSVPIRIGYSQELVGYNPFRWQRKIEPLKYEKIKKELLYHIEEVSEQATTYFFALAMAQAEYDLARENVASTDTLYRTGQERHKIASISQADLLTLKLDALNARNTLKNAEISLKRAMFSLASFLNFDKNTELRLRLPNHPLSMDISLDEALRTARENNPDYLGFRQQILEAEQAVDKTRKEARFNASVSASIGFNQVADKLKDAYRNPLQQDIVSVSVSIPLVDWGVRKGKYNVAKNNLSVTRISARQEEVSLEEDVTLTVGDFNIQQDLISSAEEALDLAVLAYQQTKQRFLIGKADINSLTLSLSRQQEAQRNYISALQNYWLSYYKIRKLTLHDFETGLPLSRQFDYQHQIE